MARGSSRYVLGIDLGTTYTAVAVHTLGDGVSAPGGSDRGRWHMAELGTRSATIPSLVLVREDGTTLVGEAAERRSLIEPTRVAREFKRRLGDSVPILLGGSPFSAEQLTAKLLSHTIERVAELEGGPPAGLALTHPANWGAFKLDVLRAAVQLAGFNDKTVTFISEPEAAALSYAAHDRPPEGARVAVYDLGGGTFDVAILEDRGERYALIGEPGGVERLGGIDFDEALFRHVLGLTDGADALDPADPTITADLVALRQSCVAAKEALSVETDTAIAVRVGPIRDEIRVVRSEFESLIRPTLEFTIDALERTLETAELRPADLHAVLLVGGSSRIPLISQLVSASVQRPVALDIHPKHAVALGAALVAAGTAPADVAQQDLPVVVISHDEDSDSPYAPPRDRPTAPADRPPPPPPTSDPPVVQAEPPAPPPPVEQPPVEPPAVEPRGAAAAEAAPPAEAPPPQTEVPPQEEVHAVPTVSNPPLVTTPRREIFTPERNRERSQSGTPRWLGGLALGIFVGLVALLAVYLVNRNPDDDGGSASTTTSSTSAVVIDTNASSTTSPPPASLPLELRNWLIARNKANEDLELSGGGPAAVIRCQQFLTETRNTYGAPASSDSVIPAALVTALAQVDAARRQLATNLVEVSIQRFDACAAGDDELYDQLQAQEDELLTALINVP